jgi:hypothetical protein
MLVMADGQDGGKEKGTLHSSFKVAVYKSSRSWCGTNVDGKEKKK